MSSRAQAETMLRRFAAGDAPEVPIGEMALALAAFTQPGSDWDHGLRHLQSLAEDVGTRVAKLVPPVDVVQAVAALRETIVGRFGYQCDPLQPLVPPDPTNPNPAPLVADHLGMMIERRRGSPAGLAVLFLHAARAQGWAMAAIDFPGSILLRLTVGGHCALLDPGQDGADVPPHQLRARLKEARGPKAELRPGQLVDLPDSEVLLIMQSTAKEQQLRAGSLNRAVGTVESMLLLAPGRADLWRQLGLLEVHLGRVPEAIAALEHSLALMPQGPQRQRTAALLRALRAEHN